MTPNKCRGLVEVLLENLLEQQNGILESVSMINTAVIDNKDITMCVDKSGMNQLTGSCHSHTIF